ncbi:MAG TPA: hypothetical protein VKM55_28405 [Candidatus Lokiarchaeia archaeon]|nr:hypothetical protein [Candidatus Lokiarchaeia archaeon]
MVIFKENIDEAKQRMDAWWDHELVDRPVIAYTIPKEIRAEAGWDGWYIARHPDSIEDTLDLFEKSHLDTEFLGEQFPIFWPNYGAGAMALVLGAASEFKSDTVWFYPKEPISLDEVTSFLEATEMNANNPWYERMVRITEYAARRAGSTYQVGVTDLGGILDILASFLDPKDIFYAMKNKPDIIDTCRAIILEKWHAMYDAMAGIIQEHCGGTSAWMGLWDRKRWYSIQCDFCYMLSPKWFERFVLPDIAEQARRLDHTIYHLDGVGQLPFLDKILDITELTGIQWVPGSGKPPMGDDAWMPVYKKIQAAGKNIEAGTSPELLAKMYRELDPRGLYVNAHFPGKLYAEFFLPSFMGGMGGIDDEES